MTTETGCTIDGPITEEIQALNLLSMYLDQFKRGWSHTAVYLLRDRTDEGGQSELRVLQAGLHAAQGRRLSAQPHDDPGRPGHARQSPAD